MRDKKEVSQYSFTKKQKEANKKRLQHAQIHGEFLQAVNT
jgi:hypothetical protein